MFTKIITTVFFVLVIFAGSTIFAQKQKVTVNLTASGYHPASFRLRKGVRAKVTFVRKTEATCGEVIVMPAYGVHRDLPLNQPVTITFTPRKSGTFNFTCGMDMLRGKIIVN